MNESSIAFLRTYDRIKKNNRKCEAWLDERLAEIGGCGDGGCIVVQPQGQHTNGGCRCSRDYFKMQRVVSAYKSYRMSLQK